MQTFRPHLGMGLTRAQLILARRADLHTKGRIHLRRLVFSSTLFPCSRAADHTLSVLTDSSMSYLAICGQLRSVLRLNLIVGCAGRSVYSGLDAGNLQSVGRLPVFALFIQRSVRYLPPPLFTEPISKSSIIGERMRNDIVVTFSGHTPPGQSSKRRGIAKRNRHSD